MVLARVTPEHRRAWVAKSAFLVDIFHEPVEKSPVFPRFIHRFDKVPLH